MDPSAEHKDMQSQIVQQTPGTAAKASEPPLGKARAAKEGKVAKEARTQTEGVIDTPQTGQPIP